MAGKADCRKRKCLMENDNHLQSVKVSSANSLLLQAVNKGSHTEVASLLESLFVQISSKTLATAVLQASSNGHKRLMQLFIKHGVNINNKNAKGYTALMVAAEHGYLDIVRLLVKNGGDVNSKTKGGKTALILATEKACSLPIMEFLISHKCHADVNIQDKEGRTALMVSAQLCDIAAMRVLMYHKETDLDLQDKKGKTAFDIAKQNGIHEEFCTLQECIGNFCLNPLILSVMRGNFCLLKEFLDDDYHNIEQTNIDGCTPLMLALTGMSQDYKDRNVSKDIVLTLIKSGADVNKLCSDHFECTPLLCAVESGNLEAVRLLVEHGANINAQMPVSKLSALMMAAQKGLCDIMEFLLKNGADFSLKDFNDCTALTSALKNGKINCVDLLIQHGAEIDDKDLILAACMDIDPEQYLLFSSVTEKIAASGMCCTLIVRCFSKKNYALVEFLLDHGADMKRHFNSLLLTAVTKDSGMAKLLLDRGAQVSKVDDFGMTALMKAVCSDNKDAVYLLIERGADVNIESNGRTALTFAIMEQARNALEALLNGGADVNYASQLPLGSIPLHLSISLGYNDIAELLISHGADINSVDKTGQTPLLLAVGLRNYDIINLLIAEGADLDKQTFSGSIALHIALTRQEIRIAEMLIRAGADINVSDDMGKTALMICAQLCTTDIMLLLLKNGADVNATDESGSTALLYAVKHSIFLTDKAEMLLNYGADINKANNDGQTAFMIASRFCKPSMLKFLLDHGANLDAQDRLGSTALIHALAVRNERVDFLISLGADVNIQNNLGYTSLMVAADKCNDLAMKALLKAGADVHVVEKTNRNVLSIALAGYNKCHLCFGEDFACRHYVCMEMLANAGAKPDMSNQCILALYKAIICNKLKLVRLLVGCGVPPLEMPRNPYDFMNYSVPQNFFTAICGSPCHHSVLHNFLLAINTSVHARSPLSTAIFCKNAAICQFFSKNWYLNDNDMSRKSLYMFSDFFANTRGTRLATACEGIFFQPWSLTILSFVTVSTCVSSSRDREKRIRALPIPLILQEKLLYSNVSDLTAAASENKDIVNFVLPHHSLVGLNYMD